MSQGSDQQHEIAHYGTLQIDRWGLLARSDRPISTISWTCCWITGPSHFFPYSASLHLSPNEIILHGKDHDQAWFYHVCSERLLSLGGWTLCRIVLIKNYVAKFLFHF